MLQMEKQNSTKLKKKKWLTFVARNFDSNAITSVKNFLNWKKIEKNWPLWRREKQLKNALAEKKEDVGNLGVPQVLGF